MTTQNLEGRPIPGKTLAWIIAIFISLGCLFTCFVLLRSIRMFDELFKGLGMELPVATKFLISNLCLDISSLLWRSSGLLNWQRAYRS